MAEAKKKVNSKVEKPSKEEKTEKTARVTKKAVSKKPLVTKEKKIKNPDDKRGKKYREVLKNIDRDKFYTYEEALKLLKSTSTTKFDASCEVHIKLGIKTDQADQNIRMAIDLPEGTGKNVKVAAIVSGEKDKEAKEAGADVVGSEDLIEKISKGFMDFDVVIATPDMMGKLGKIGKILGTKGLMPNPKTETVTDNPKRTIAQLKKGRVEARNDKFGIVHVLFGKVSMDEEKLLNNFKALLDTLNKSKPQTSKGQFIRRISVATTMGPGLKIDVDKTLKNL